MLDVERSIESNLFAHQNEKTYVDKLLAKEDVNSIRELIRKPRLTREELLALLYNLSSSELKLYNFSEWERYVMSKYFIWIRDFVKACEMFYDYQELLKSKASEGYLPDKRVNLLKELYIINGKDPNELVVTKFVLKPRTLQLVDNGILMMEHDAKFLIDLYLNICRSSLSLGATGFMELLKNKFEVSYPQANHQFNPGADKAGWFQQGGNK